MTVLASSGMVWLVGKLYYRALYHGAAQQKRLGLQRRLTPSAYRLNMR